MARTLGLMGIPVETGQPVPGCGRAPDSIRGLNLVGDIEQLGFTVTDYGDMEAARVLEDVTIFKTRLPNTWVENTHQTGALVEQALLANDVAMVMGGDRSLTTGSILAHHAVDRDICVVWVGRKPCLHTVLSSATGNMNEMPLFLLISDMQHEMPWISRFQTVLPILPASSIAFVGLHAVDDYERYVINKYGIKAMSTTDIDRMGMASVIRESLMTINPGFKKSIHLCFNMDALDPLYGPSSSDCAPGGLTMRETITIGEFLFSTGRLRVMDIVEFNPQLGSDKDNEVTRRSIVETVLAALGAQRAGTPFIDPNFYMWQKHNLCRGIHFQ